ncbi:tRNA-uridine aminocarboxypropyltransferase [Noviherbaspirillum autotrophicum]|uniref:tRNA-uridine aminocarboxypropyltransferase n=1 Tax=Noviherbaspirillum autotrophicum TaxID=709839 RepID=A0A0C1YR94_9BURK|nr:tRNA-uridine aminocarboxypropyltransferase [Noviherbaspirillum autotrophicum]KIF83152.1 hypothetical protein TSA66_23625 [Noviherbaspirillum autotrophicum]
MTSSSSARRPVCARCQRAQSACICQWVIPVAHAVEVLVLQHPLEVGHAKGSARLLHLCLPHSRLAVGEAFAEQELSALLHEPFAPCTQASKSQAPPRHAILLYPDTPAGTAPVPPLAGVPLDDPGRLRLVVLDGTWRKSRKMLYANPLLQALPRLALREPPASQYLIRKAHGAHQLSTLEAACYALMHLEQDEAKYRPLLQAFNGFVAQQLAFRPQQAPAGQSC